MSQPDQTPPPLARQVVSDDRDDLAILHRLGLLVESLGDIRLSGREEAVLTIIAELDEGVVDPAGYVVPELVAVIRRVRAAAVSLPPRQVRR